MSMIPRPEKSASASCWLAPGKDRTLIVVSGDKGFAGAFNANIIKAALQFIAESKDELNVDIEAIGRKGRDLFRRRYPAC